MISQLLIISELRRIADYLRRTDMPNLLGVLYARELIMIADLLERELAASLKPKEEE